MCRCDWARENDLLEKYHDEKWGIPCKDDKELFKLLTLEMFQSGLSWLTILKKENEFIKAFEDFDVEKISNYGEEKIQELLNNSGIIRHRMKIESTINNAKVFIKVKEKYGSFSKFIWSYTFDTPIINPWTSAKEVPSKTPLSEKISKDLKSLGFKFLGPTTVYSFLQASGIINDHIISCDYKYKE